MRARRSVLINFVFFFFFWKTLDGKEETNRGKCCRGGSIQSDQDETDEDRAQGRVRSVGTT